VAAAGVVVAAGAAAGVDVGARALDELVAVSALLLQPTARAMRENEMELRNRESALPGVRVIEVASASEEDG
jgi:hypothetical protein